MNDQHMKVINEWIRAHADEAQSKLPDDPRHPFGRNAIAHFHTMIQWVWGVKHTKDVSDVDFDDVMDVLHLTLKYASALDVEQYLPEVHHTHQREPSKTPTHDDIFLLND